MSGAKGPSIAPMVLALIKDRAALRFGAGVSLGLGFSIAVILATIGIMDGFEIALKSALHKASGDLMFYARAQYFSVSTAQNAARAAGLKDFVAAVQTEGFMIFNEQSRGVQIRGVSPEGFHKLTKLELKIKEGELALGSELANQLGVGPGEEVALALAHAGDTSSGLPGVHRVKVGQVVTHGLYQKDLRLAYALPADLRRLAGVQEEQVNWASANVPEGQELESAKARLQGELGPDFVVRTFWHEFSSLLEDVKVEKLVIGLILQLIVVIACFNVVAFAVFLNEKKARELFLFKALGLSPKGLRRLWSSIAMGLWSSACLLSIALVAVFDWCLGHLDFLRLPGEIYNLERLTLRLSVGDYLLVFAAAGVWAVLVSLPGLRRLSKGPVLTGLRKEFS